MPEVATADRFEEELRKGKPTAPKPTSARRPRDDLDLEMGGGRTGAKMSRHETDDDMPSKSRQHHRATSSTAATKSSRSTKSAAVAANAAKASPSAGVVGSVTLSLALSKKSMLVVSMPKRECVYLIDVCEEGMERQ